MRAAPKTARKAKGEALVYSENHCRTDLLYETDPFFSGLLERIPTESQPFRNTTRHRNLEQHFEALRREFAGKPLICLTLARHIVCLRRQIDVEENWSQFQLLLAKYKGYIIAEMNLRWLLSICDTYADYGTPVERCAALIVVTCINTLKLAETERLLLQDCVLDENKIRAQKPGTPLAGCPVLSDIWHSSLARLRESDNLFSRLSRHHRTGEFFAPQGS
jgi:hypothetical protein